MTMHGIKILSLFSSVKSFSIADLGIRKMPMSSLDDNDDVYGTGIVNERAFQTMWDFKKIA